MSPYLVALRSKYKVRGDWLHKDPIKNYSTTLRATERLKVLICKCECNIVGDDSKIDLEGPLVTKFLTYHAWSFYLYKSIAGFQSHMRLGAGSTSYSWTFFTKIVDAIIKIPISSVTREDKLVRVPDLKGNFSARSTMKTRLGDLWSHPSEPLWTKLALEMQAA